MTKRWRDAGAWACCLGMLLGTDCTQAARPASDGSRYVSTTLPSSQAGALAPGLTQDADGGAPTPAADGGQILECYSPDKPQNAYVPGAHGCQCSGQQFWCVSALPMPDIAYNLICTGDHWQSAPDGTTCAAPPPTNCESGQVFPTAEACMALHPDCYPMADGRICGVDPGSCRTAEDCPTEHRGINGGGFVAYSCIKPDDRAHCGPVLGDPPTACTDDSQCAAGKICRPDPSIPIGWDQPHAFCAAACGSDGDCRATDTCESNGHCRPRTCSECCPFFSCSSGVCLIPDCVQDSDCPSGGYCVNKRCSGTLGSCEISCL